MRLLIILLFILGISCSKEHSSVTYSDVTNIEISLIKDDHTSSNEYVVSSFGEFGVYNQTPIMVAINVTWPDGRYTVASIFSYNSDSIVIADDYLELTAKDFYLYVHDGVGEISNVSIEDMLNSEFLIHDTITIADLYPTCTTCNETDVLHWGSNERWVKLRLHDFSIILNDL